jgi:hypothetical protein
MSSSPPTTNEARKVDLLLTLFTALGNADECLDEDDHSKLKEKYNEYRSLCSPSIQQQLDDESGTGKRVADYPWEEAMDTEKGKKWSVLLMRCAWATKGFVDNGEGVKWEARAMEMQRKVKGAVGGKWTETQDDQMVEVFKEVLGSSLDVGNTGWV